VTSGLPQGYEVRFSMPDVVMTLRQHPFRDCQILVARARCLDRVTRRPEDLNMEFDVHPGMPLEIAMRRALLSLVQHEVDESIWVNGVLVFDPHKDEQP
jgi:hypothetical protein